MEVLSYAHSTTRLPRQRPRWVDAITWAAGASTLLLFAVALLVSWGAVQYTRRIPLSEIFAYCANVDIAEQVSRSPRTIWQTCFLPLALLMLVMFSRARSVRASIVIASTAAAMPLLWLGPVAAIAVIIALVVVPPAILGMEDGESWSEGFVKLGAIGAWTLLWLATLLIILLTKKSWPLRKGPF